MKEVMKKINSELREGTLRHVNGGKTCTRMYCKDCGYDYLWDGYYVGKQYVCPECGGYCYRGIEIVDL